MQTYDIQVANTHNFCGNEIVAHNTYISGMWVWFTHPTTFKLELREYRGPDADNTRNIGAVGRAYNTIYVNNIVGSGGLGYWSRGTGACFFQLRLPTESPPQLPQQQLQPLPQQAQTMLFRAGGVSIILTVGSTGSLTFNAVTNDIVTRNKRTPLPHAKWDLGMWGLARPILCRSLHVEGQCVAAGTLDQTPSAQEVKSEKSKVQRGRPDPDDDDWEDGPLRMYYLAMR